MEFSYGVSVKEGKIWELLRGVEPTPCQQRVGMLNQWAKEDSLEIKEL